MLQMLYPDTHALAVNIVLHRTVLLLSVAAVLLFIQEQQEGLLLKGA